MTKIAVIAGSSRGARIGLQITEWVKAVANNPAVELIDLAEENLPFFDEPASPKSGNPYQHDHTKRWAAKIADYDGFVFVFPEYNGSYPAVLKNAVDYLYPEWKNKPVSYVSYGFGAGKRAAAAFSALAENVDLRLTEQVANLTLRPEIFAADGSIKDPDVAFASEAEAVTNAVGSVIAKAQAS